MEGIFNTVLMTSFYATIVGMAVILLKGILKNKLNPQWHYLIWVVLILKLLIPFGPESAVSLFNIMPQIHEQNEVQRASETHNYNNVYLPNENTVPYEQPSQQQYTAKNMGDNKTENMEINVRNVLSYLWLAGAFLTLIWLLYTYYLFYRKLRKSSYDLDLRVVNIFEKCKARMGVNKKITLLIQDEIGTPALFGVVSPKILLTPEITKLSDKDVEYILLHELAHYKRKDLIANYLLLAFQAIHWFNPAMWYCFKLIRQDMEVATDERVLSILQKAEHKDYGRALIAILESFTRPALAPKLLGMADDRKNIERRLKMIKMAEFFKSKRNITIIIGVLCVITLGGMFLTSGISAKDKDKNDSGSTTFLSSYDAEELFKHKSLYVGDASNVGNLLSKLPFAGYRRGMSLATESEPYGITVNYDLASVDMGLEQIRWTLYDNALILFALIKNVDEITFNTDININPDLSNRKKVQIKRAEIVNDLWENSRDIQTFKQFLKNLSSTLIVSPARYSTFMSSTPGIAIRPGYQDHQGYVRYSTDKGSLFTWNGSTMSEPVETIDLSFETRVFWSPTGGNSEMRKGESNIITASVFDERGNELDKKYVTVICESPATYTVELSSDIILIGGAPPQVQKPKSIDDAVSDAIKGRSNSYKRDECVTEGHIILDKEEKDGTVKVYTVSSIGGFGFENGIFTKVSGSGSIPTVMTFSINENGEYTLLEYKEPLDGAGYAGSIKKMFPKRLHNRVISSNEDYSDLVRQQEKQAAEYLKSIGREAKISARYVEKKLSDINVEAKNKLFAEYTKFDQFLNTCPYWIGTREQIEDGIRYIYETSQSRTSDGYDLITFKKVKEDGTLVEERKYKIVGSEPQLMEKSAENETSNAVDISEDDKAKALEVVTKYFEAFKEADYKIMSTLATPRNNKQLMNPEAVWGMKWARAKKIEMVSDPGFLRVTNSIVFDVSVDMETVKTSAMYPSTQTSFYVILVKDERGNWKVDGYTTG